MSGMKNADPDMQEEIDAYISKGLATFGVLILVCTGIFIGCIILYTLNFESCMFTIFLKFWVSETRACF